MSKSIIFDCKTQLQRRSMYRIASLALAFVLVFGSLGGADFVNANYSAAYSVDPLPGAVEYVEGRHRSPVTPLAREFIDASQGQQWLLNEVERILNARQTSIDNLTQRDLDLITSLGFQGRNIEGFIPRSIGHFPNLQYLFMGDNRLSGELPAELFNLQRLRNIDLSNNLFRNNVDPRFANISTLQVLRLSGNGHTGNIPLALMTHSNLMTLDLSDNRLEGGISDSISGLTNLRFLDLSRNPNLGGIIPNTITDMTTLQILAIWGSGLTGSIPADIGNLVNLMHLDLGNNNLSGTIPNSIEDLVQLREFTISFNRITGTIPNAFYDMERILRVHLDRNYLRGHIPSSLLYCFEERDAMVTFAWNYLTGPNALAIEREAGVSVSNGNFIDGTNRGANALQFQLAIRSANGYIQVGTGAYTNLWPLLHNVFAIGRTNEAKPIRPYHEYVISLVNPADGSRISINPSGGLNVRLLEEVSYLNALHLVIKIRYNTNSDFSRVTFRIGTEAPPAGGGMPGGGGGIPGDTIIPDVEVPLGFLCRPYILGYPDGSVRPDRHITREEAAVMMYRIIERFETPGLALVAPFVDVPIERWSSGYIDFVRVERIMQGYEDGTFRPANSMSRNEFAVLLVNLSGRPLITERPDNFALTDVPDNWAAPYIFTAHQAGYIQGFPDGTFRGNQPVTRAEATRMLNGAMGRTPNRAQWTDDELNPFNDITRSHWAYYEILEASVEHVHLGGITLMPFHNRIRHQLEELLENGDAQSDEDDNEDNENENGDDDDNSDEDENEEDAA